MVEFQGRMAIWDIERFRRLGPCSKTRRLSRNVSGRTWAPGAGAILPAWSGGRLNRLAVEPDCRENGQDDEGDQRRELGFFKWRLALRWSQHLQRRHFHKELRNQDKNIEVEGEHGRDRPLPQCFFPDCATLYESAGVEGAASNQIGRPHV